MTRQRLRTLHVDSEMLWSGGQVQMTALCSYLQTRGHHVVLACRPGSALLDWARDNDISAVPVEMRTHASWVSVFALRSLIRREHPDVVHLHSSRAHLLGSAAARLAGAGTVVATRRMDGPIVMRWPNTGAYGPWTTRLIAISGAVRDVMIDCGVSADRISLIHSGADVERFAAGSKDPDLRRRLGIAPDRSLVCCAAGLAQRKGLRYLIEAAALLRGNGVPVHLILAGEGPERGSLEELSRDKGVDVSFVGNYRDMPSLLKSIDVFVMPSLAEGLGVAVLEAMAAARPVVASSVGGLRESVVDQVTGLLVPPADPSGLASAIGRLVADPATAEQYGRAGQARAAEKFSLVRMCQANEALYYDLLGSPRVCVEES